MQSIIEYLEANNCFYQTEDGSWVFEPIKNYGFLTAEMVGLIHQHLNHLHNKTKEDEANLS